MHNNKLDTRLDFFLDTYIYEILFQVVLTNTVKYFSTNHYETYFKYLIYFSIYGTNILNT